MAQIDEPAPTFRLIAARGEFVDRAWPATGTANASFRFAAEPPAEAWGAWAGSGANHHSSATPGALTGRIGSVAPHLRMELTTL